MKLRPRFFTDHNLLGAEVVYETGTQDGKRLRNWCHLFDEIHTIECDNKLYLEASRRLARFPHIHCHYGLSQYVLPVIIDPDRTSLFILDAHFVASDPRVPRPKETECPVLDELEIILSIRWNAKFTVVIDDRPMFEDRFWTSQRCTGYDWKQWPTINEIRKVAECSNLIWREAAETIVLEHR